MINIVGHILSAFLTFHWLLVKNQQTIGIFAQAWAVAKCVKMFDIFLQIF